MERYMFRRRSGRAGVAALAVAIVLALGGGAWASHTFSDVPDLAFYHSAVEWIFNRNITAGCAVGLYCPNNSVSRGEMAVFMRNLGLALTPTTLYTSQDAGPLDLDAAPIVCQSDLFAVTGHPRTAVMNGQMRVQAGGAMAYGAFLVSSPDAGVTWSPLNVLPFPQQSTAAGELSSVHVYAENAMIVGNTYRFGIGLLRSSGTADINDADCELFVQVINRNGTTSPFAPRP